MSSVSTALHLWLWSMTKEETHKLVCLNAGQRWLYVLFFSSSLRVFTGQTCFCLAHTASIKFWKFWAHCVFVGCYEKIQRNVLLYFFFFNDLFSFVTIFQHKHHKAQSKSKYKWFHSTQDCWECLFLFKRSSVSLATSSGDVLRLRPTEYPSPPHPEEELQWRPLYFYFHRVF